MTRVSSPFWYSEVSFTWEFYNLFQRRRIRGWGVSVTFLLLPPFKNSFSVWYFICQDATFGGSMFWIPLLRSGIHHWLIFPFSLVGMAVQHPEYPSSLTLLAPLSPHVPHPPCRSQLGFQNHKRNHKVLHPLLCQLLGEHSVFTSLLLFISYVTLLWTFSYLFCIQ